MINRRRVRDGDLDYLKNITRRGGEHIQSHLLEITKLDQQELNLKQQKELLRSEQNVLSEQISTASPEQKSLLLQKASELKIQTQQLEEEQAQIQQRLELLLVETPNSLHPSVPHGTSEEDNQLIRVSGTPTQFAYEPLSHDELARLHHGLEQERAVRLAGSRFTVFTGGIARLHRALIQMFLDTHIQYGYQEVIVPHVVNRQTMWSNGNLPKFEEDLYQTVDKDLFLIPTAEVSLTNLYRGEILETEQLPLKMAAHTSCFRVEAGAAGKDTSGWIRQHEFQKVELVHLVEPEQSYQALETMTEDAERVLKLLELPYRVMLLCDSDTGFCAAKTYDLEVWMPSQGKYREISSVSNCTDFQTRRGMTRYRPEPGAKAELLHSLNGSGVAVGRALAAVLENHQQWDGSIKIPKALQPYLQQSLLKMNTR